MCSSSLFLSGSSWFLVWWCTVRTAVLACDIYNSNLLSCLLVGCVLPFNNIASSLLLERDFFMEPPNKCTLQIPYECQSSTNQPVHCPSSDYYQPPLPVNVTTNGKYYSELTADDIDCGDDDWSDGCAKEFCNRQTDGIKAAATVMSIPYIISACLSPLLGGFVDRFGMRAVIATLAPASLVAVHLLMAETDVDPIGVFKLSLFLLLF